MLHRKNLNQWLVSHPQTIMKPFPHLQKLIISKCIYQTHNSLMSIVNVKLATFCDGTIVTENNSINGKCQLPMSISARIDKL